MTRWNVLFQNKFRGCRILTSFRDPYVGTEIKVYLLPNEFDLVGVLNGEDASVVNPLHSLHKESKRILGLLDQAREGEEVGTLEVRRRVTLEVLNHKPIRRKLNAGTARVALQGNNRRVRNKLLGS